MSFHSYWMSLFIFLAAILLSCRFNFSLAWVTTNVTREKLRQEDLLDVRI